MFANDFHIVLQWAKEETIKMPSHVFFNAPIACVKKILAVSDKLAYCQNTGFVPLVKKILWERHSLFAQKIAEPASVINKRL